MEWRRGREDPDGQLWKVQSHREKAGKTGEQKSAGVVCGFKSCKIDQVKDSLKKKSLSSEANSKYSFSSIVEAESVL